MNITFFYAGLATFLHIALTLNVIFLRRSFKVAVGDGSERRLERAIRAFGNFAEHTPIFLILMGLYERHQAESFSLHLIGSLFLFGRVLHALSLNYFEPVKKIIYVRQIAMVTNLLILCFLALKGFLV